MTTEEFSNEFDVLIQSYSNVDLFGKQNPIAFDEYEKSVFLTKAQELIVISLYTGKNPFGDSFEKTEELRRYLSDLVTTVHLSKVGTVAPLGVNENSLFFLLPDNLLFITYEAVKLSPAEEGCLKSKELLVLPTTQDEYYRTSRNPFRKANERRALRLDIKDNIVEIISQYNIDTYIVRYISRPEPIILIDLEEGLSINNTGKTKTECKLNPALHRIILEEAVKQAISSKAGK